MKHKLEIDWSHDSYDCDDCGMSDATGAVAHLDGVKIVDIQARAHCYDGSGEAQLAGIFAIALERLGVELYTIDDKGFADTSGMMEALGIKLEGKELNEDMELEAVLLRALDDRDVEVVDTESDLKYIRSTFHGVPEFPDFDVRWHIGTCRKMDHDGNFIDVTKEGTE